MSQATADHVTETANRATDLFIDRRSYDPAIGAPGRERRQFSNGHDEATPEARELAKAIDEYKLQHRRRFITYDEMLGVIKELGYRR